MTASPFFLQALASACAPRRCRLIGIATSMLVSACSLGPSYQRPPVSTPNGWQAETTGMAAGWPSADWWHQFNSDGLNRLIERSAHDNDDIAAAIARVQEADAQARIAGAPLLPSLQAGFEAQRERVQSSSGPVTSNAYGPSLAASYELDFWGRNRALHGAALAAADASRFDRATVELTIMTSVATTYFQAQTLHDRLRIAQNDLDAARSILSGLQAQEQAGIANALDIAQQTTAVATQYAAIPPLRAQLNQTLDELAILTGSMPEAATFQPDGLDNLTLPTVQAGLPSGLLARRPDVASAEAQLIAANANVAAARAAFFPNISLTASGGYLNSSLSDLFNPGNAVFSLGANLLQPIFEGGALQAQSDYTKAHERELLADYHKAVIGAFGNAEDALTAVAQTAEQERRQKEALTAARRAYSFAQAQLHAGTINVLTLLNTQSAEFSAEDAFAQVRLSHLQALVSLYGALGGGWQQSAVSESKG